MAERFPYDVDMKFLPVLAPFAFRPGRDSVRIEDGHLLASFGWFRFTTELANVEGAHVTRDYRWWTAVGVRLSFADDGLTLGTNNRAGVCIHFREKVPSLFKRSGHSALTVTVRDLDGLTRALSDGA